MTAGTIPGTVMTIVINGPMSGRVITMATDGFHGWNEHYHDDNWTDAWRKRDPDDECRTSHWEMSSWCSSHWETSGSNETDKCSTNREGQQWSNHSFFETMNVDQLINSLCRGDDDAATFRRIEVDPGESLADTAAQSGVIDIRPFRKAEEALFHKFGLKPRVIPGDNQAVGIGGKAEVLGKVEMPSGMGGVNGIVKWLTVPQYHLSHQRLFSNKLVP